MALRTQAPDEIRSWLRELCEHDGVAGAAKFLEVDDGTIARAMAGLTVNRGTVVQLEAAYRDGRKVG